MQSTINKSLIRDFYRRAVNQGDIDFADQLISEDYIQHSLALKPGKVGIMEALQLMKQMPKPLATSAPFIRLIAEGDYVVTNLSFDWGGKQKVVVDLFRFENGKVIEHWDAVQDQPEWTINGHAMMDGPMPLEDNNLTGPNKGIVNGFFQRVLIDRQLDVLPHYVERDLIQHKPEIANGINGLQDYLSQNPNELAISKILLSIGEGDFVVVQSEGTSAQEPTMFYDIFRLTQGKIVEQWGVSQRLM
ncbi:nuclear transport factor 2 family protein [Spirosoma aerophilum]